MTPYFSPSSFPTSIIVTDLASGTSKVDCLGCGKLVETLRKNEELCGQCYETWPTRFAACFLKVKFG
jgi:hypothetical protein